MIVYKIDVIAELKKNGYSTYKIRKNNILFEATLTKIRRGEIVNAATIDRLCSLLHMQPGDILAYVPDDPAGNTAGTIHPADDPQTP